MRNFLNTIEVSYVIKGFDRGGQSTMQTKYLWFNLQKSNCIRKFTSNLNKPNKGIRIWAHEKKQAAAHITMNFIHLVNTDINIHFFFSMVERFDEQEQKKIIRD